jgi:F-type H+-transporting ATPase subunit gamma
MADIRDLRLRIKGVKNTQKITKGMKTMSAIRLQRAQARAMASKPYTNALMEMVAHISGDGYFKENLCDGTLYVVFTSDRGLCGAFNDNLLRAVEAEMQKNKGQKYHLILIGTKAVAFFSRKGYEIHSKYSQLPPDPTISISNLVVEDCRKLFNECKVGKVILAYNHFISKLNYSILFRQLLPVQKKETPGLEGAKVNFSFEPEEGIVISSLIKMYLESTVYQAFLDSYAGEYAARLVAMSKATDNADDMIGTLTLQMNKTRQANITREILEVVSGAEALGI